MQRKYFFLILLFLGLTGLKAQVAPYCFTQSTATYSAITGGSVLGTIANDDDAFTALNIGFTFNFKGVNYTQFCVNTNGYLIMGPTENGASYNPISFANDDYVISGLGTDLAAQTGSVLRYQTTGTSPNRILTVQWLNYSTFGNADNINFQIRLLEGSNNIQFNYGSFTLDPLTFAAAEVGLRGVTANLDDFNNVYVENTVNTWATPVILGNDLYASCGIEAPTFRPSSGLRYQWAPSTLTNVVTPVSACPGSSVTLNATASSGTINWYSTATSTTILGSGATYTTPVINGSDTFFVAMNGCNTQRVPVYVDISGELSSRFAFTQNSSTYAAITGGTVLGTTANDTNYFNALPIGFTFNYRGTNYTQFCAATDGYISLGATTTTFSTAPVTFPVDDNVISALGGDLAGQAGSVLRYQTTGTSPNRVLTIQWSNYRFAGGTGMNYNFQIKLFETTNVIQIIYGAFTQPAGAFNFFEVGLVGDTTGAFHDFLGRTVLETVHTWATSANANTLFDVFAEINENTFKPASGQRYIYTPYQINTTTPASRCGAGTVTLSATSNASTIQWFSSATGGTPLFTGASFTTPSISTTTTYYVSAIGASCQILPRIPVIATINPLPTVTASASTTSICAGGSTTLTASGASTYTWNPGNLSGASVTVSPTATTTYTVTGTSAAGCTGTSNLTVTVNALPTVTATA
ncbi:MAG: hypothetical protein IM638_17915, partial [Bacteroidetes bacterium]|nr:hypothetical protein [Bacteroidota bacterium]